MNLADFDYHLPKELIAQRPLPKRDDSRLLTLDRATQTMEHRHFFDLPDLLDPDSMLVLNESRVIPARLKFRLGNGNAEIFLVKPLEGGSWECLVRPGDKFEPKSSGSIDPECRYKVRGLTPEGLRIIHFHCDDFAAYVKRMGHVPTPPYIKETLDEPERYQTVYSKIDGSVATPTAGLHFTKELFRKLEAKGIGVEFVTLHVGFGTFAPVKTERIEEHPIHGEWFELKKEAADRLNHAKLQGKKIVAVGTTSVRVLENCATEPGILIPDSGETHLFIYPGYRFNFVDQIVTNFHLPKSSLLMLVSAFAGRDSIMKAYETAKKEGYRFFSFGDAMWIR